MKPEITLAIQCHNFQRRLCWMLSSLAQQTLQGIVCVDVAHVSGNGTPTTESVVEFFSHKVRIRRTEYSCIDQFQYRGLVRNRQLQECETEWLMFGDCDMVYHPEYFERLMDHLRRIHPNAKGMLSSGRSSNPKELAIALVDREVMDKPREVEKAFALADALPKIKKSNIGAGFCQLINRNHCPHDGYYVKPNENGDWGFNRGWNTKSDMKFRRRIGLHGAPRQPLPEWFTWGAIHLNHNRDPEAGRHLEEQR